MDRIAMTTSTQPIGVAIIPERKRTEPLFRLMAITLDARLRCQSNGNEEWFQRHSDTLKVIEALLPSGSGIDCGTKIDLDKSTGEKLVLTMSYHHMDESGFYDGWTDHTITIKPTFIHGLDLSISGRNRNDIKDCLHEVYGNALRQDVEQDSQGNLKLIY